MYAINLFSICGVLVSVLLALGKSSKEEAAYHVDKINNTGAAFAKIGNGQFYNDKLYVYANIDVPNYEKHLETLSSYVRTINGLCYSLNKKSKNEILKCETERTEVKGHGTVINTGPGIKSTSVNCSKTKEGSENTAERCLLRSRMLNQQLKKAVNTNKIIQHAVDHHSRTTRGLINGLGNMLHVITGVMDNEDAVRIENKINNLDTTQSELVELSKDAIYMVQTLRKDINDSLAMLHGEQNQTRRTINEIISNLENTQKMSDILQLHLDVTELVDAVYMELTAIENDQHEIMTVMMSIQSGRIHPSIIGEDIMIEIYHKLASKLKTSTIPDKLDLSKTFEVTYISKNGSLVIKVGVPIPDPEVFQFNKIYLIPQVTQAVSMIYDMEVQYVASNAAGTLFAGMNEANYQACSKVTVENNLPFLLCRQMEPLSRDGDGSCVIQLFKGKRFPVNACDYKVIKTKEIFTKMSSTNRWLYSFQTQRTLKIVNNKNELHEAYLNGSGIITILCNGQLHLDNRVYGVSKVSAIKNVTVKYPDVSFLPELAPNIVPDDIETVRRPRIKPLSAIEHNAGLLREGQQFDIWKNNLQRLEEHRATTNQRHYWYSGVFGTLCVALITAVLLGWFLVKRYVANNRTIVEHIELAERPGAIRTKRAHTFSFAK